MLSWHSMRREIAPRIVVDDEVCGGRPVIAGTRMLVELVLGHLATGMTAEQVAEAYDLKREDVLAVLSYAAETIADDLVRAERERADLISELLRSLDDAEDQDAVDAAWDEEIARRVEDFKAGRIRTVPWSEVRAGLEAIVNKPRGA